MDDLNKYDLSTNTENGEIIKQNIEKANNILRSIDTKKCVKENHQCSKIKQYLESL